jgi:hypothetical protein
VKDLQSINCIDPIDNYLAVMRPNVSTKKVCDKEARSSVFKDGNGRDRRRH